MNLPIHTNLYFAKKIKEGTKKHFIVSLEHDFYEVGDKLEIINSLNKLVKSEFCKSIQHIEVMFENKTIKIDNRKLLNSESLEFVKNEGYESLLGFFKMFPFNFEAKLLHWTDLKY